MDVHLGETMNIEEKHTTSDIAESANDPVTVYQRGDAETTTEAVVKAVSGVSRVPETELEPIYGAVDPDALDSLFGPRESGTSPGCEGYIEFDYNSHRVRVESDGTILVY
jgi:hypothetical protein